MKEKKDFIKLLESYFQRDDSLVKQQYEEFIASEHAALLLKKLYESIPQIEKTFNHTLPQEYKNFIEADYAWGVYGKENDFRLYDVKEIYDFNYIGKHRGNSSIEEMKDYFIFGQDDGECMAERELAEWVEGQERAMPEEEYLKLLYKYREYLERKA